MDEKRVVITGLGVISPLANTWEENWDKLISGQSGVSTLEDYENIERFPVHFAGQVKDFNPTEFFKNPKEARRADRFIQLGMAASKMAWEDSGIGENNPYNSDNFGVIVGSGIGGLGTMETQRDNFVNGGARKVSPFTIPLFIPNILSGIIAMEYGLHGPNFAIVTACATANHNLGEAWRMIKSGAMDVALAGGSEAPIQDLGLAGFSKMRALSTRNEAPEKASRPFDRDRDGFVMSEGAGVFVLEEYEAAKKRGAKIYCELVGYGLSGDAYHLTSPHPEGEGASKCMNMAVKSANIGIKDVQYVNAHGTSTGLGDVCETKAIKRSFGDYAKNGLLVSSTKSMTGHLLGAAGGIELAACIGAVQNGIVPPTINLENQDPECDLDYCANEAREVAVEYAMSNSFGFGGHNSSLIVKKV